MQALSSWYYIAMKDDVNVRISRTAYNTYSLKAARRRKKTNKRASIKQLMEEGAKLVQA